MKWNGDNNQNNQNNGRIDINIQNSMNPFKLYDRIDKNITCYNNALTGNWDDTTLSRLFFSKENIEILNNAMKKNVFDRSNGLYVIGRQSQDELKIIMRAIFLQNSLNLPTNITEQIMALNKIVLDFCVPQIYGELQGYLKYKQDVSTMYRPMDRPVVSNARNKTLELKPWF